MKTKYILQPILIILISIIFIACNDTNNIIKPQSHYAEGKFKNVVVRCDSVLVVINNYGSTYNSYEGSKSWSNDKDGIWAFAGTFGNTDWSYSEIKNDTLRFNYYFKESGSYNSSNSSSVFILFNDSTQIIEWLYITESSNYQKEPSHMYRDSYSSSESSITLKKVPYTINKNGDILVELTGSNFMDYGPILSSGSDSYSSDYSGTISSSSSSASRLKSIRSVPITSTFKIEIIKAK
ncbi:MAG: hypothetical protein WCR42_12530 [bacterium]